MKDQIQHNCMICQEKDTGRRTVYKPSPSVEFVCSRCVTKIIAGEDDMQNIIKLAFEERTRVAKKGKRGPKSKRKASRLAERG
ncbi:MAG: hypothetical protein DRP56_08535 [Planctomycetota bacterium]|nr:MAG: hypothetical protein DRP56_08535 [Planctomycetota bacterium]